MLTNLKSTYDDICIKGYVYWRNRPGQGAIEYGLILAVVVIGAGALGGPIKEGLAKAGTEIKGALDKAFK